jgi:hypothetical protein
MEEQITDHDYRPPRREPSDIVLQDDHVKVGNDLKVEGRLHQFW